MQESKRKVVLVTNSLMVGGLCSVVVEQACNFQQAGCDVHVVLLNKKGLLPDDMPCQVHNLKMSDSSAPFFYRLFYSLFRPLFRGIGNLFLGGYNARRFQVFLASLGGGEPLVILHGFRTVVTLRKLKDPVPVMAMHELQSTFIGSRASWLREKRRQLIKNCYRNGHLVAVSQAVKDDFIESFGQPEQGIRVIHNGIDAQRTRALATQDNPFSCQRPYLASMGRLVEIKGMDVLIRAYAGSKKCQDYDLVIIGDGPLKSELRALAFSLGVSDRVHFAGYVKQPFHLLRGASLYVGCSEHEGFGLAVLEALCLGVPVLCTGVGGFAEILAGQEEFFFPPADEVMLAEKLDWMLSDYANIKARQYFPVSFDLDVTAKQYLEII